MKMEMKTWPFYTFSLRPHRKHVSVCGCSYLTGAEPLGLQAAAFLQQRFFLGEDFLSFCEFSFQIFQSSSLLEHTLHFLVQPSLLLLDLLHRASQGTAGRIDIQIQTEATKMAKLFTFCP